MAGFDRNRWLQSSERAASGLGFGLLSVFGSIADGLIGSKPEPKPQPREPEPIVHADPFEAVAAENSQREQRERAEAESEWYRKQRSYGE